MPDIIELPRDATVGEFLVSTNTQKYMSGIVSEIKANSIIMSIEGFPPQEVPKEDLFIFVRM